MATTKGPVLVIGATRQQGRATTGQLLQRGWEVRAFVRDLEAPAATKLRAAGANLIEGDLDEPASVQAAMTGAYGVFMMLTPTSGVHITTEGIAAEIRWGTTVIRPRRGAERGAPRLQLAARRRAERGRRLTTRPRRRSKHASTRQVSRRPSCGRRSSWTTCKPSTVRCSTTTADWS